MLRFEPLELVQQPIELLVGDLGIVVDVVALFVMPDGVTQLAETLQRVHREPAETTKTRTRPSTSMRLSGYVRAFVVACISHDDADNRRTVERRAEQLAGDFRERAIGRQAEQHEPDQPQRRRRASRARESPRSSRARTRRAGIRRRRCRTPGTRSRRAGASRPARSAVARRPLDERRRRPQVLPHHRGVNHVPGRQPPARRDDALARLDRPLRHRLGLDRLAAARLERAGHAGSHPERVVGGVDDGVGVLRRRGRRRRSRG